MKPRWYWLAMMLCLCMNSVCEATININCIGDSITAGAGVTNASLSSYPARLQFLLGTNYSVSNYAVSGTTMLKKGDLSYWGEIPIFYASRGHPILPNVVIIMFGSNDSKPQNWVYSTNFVTDYTAFIALYTNISSNPRILICTPPPVFGANGYQINPGIVATNISPLIRALGTNLNIQVIDFQTLLAGHPEWFPDTVHPNEKGTAVMAAIVYTAIFGDTLNGLAPTLGMKFTKNNTILSWPTNAAGWVLQTNSVIGGTNAWGIPSQGAYFSNNVGTSLVSTNANNGASGFFRLWNPSATAH